MTGDAADRARWQHVKALLAQALELDDAAQRAFVDEVSAGDADLREDLVSLLAAARDDDLGLDRPPAGPAAPPVEDYVTLGPLGTALAARGRPRALLVDEIDKSDLDFANDLLNVIEEGEYHIPELGRLNLDVARVRTAEGGHAEISRGRLVADHFPFVVMTSNAEREFPAAFLRRCVRLDVLPPDRQQLERIVYSQLRGYKARFDFAAVDALIDQFVMAAASGDMSTDQLLNAIFLTVPLRGAQSAQPFDGDERDALVATLLRPISGTD